MEVLLLQDIQGIGKKDDLIVVGDGFALNHLLPLAKALVATPTVRKRYAERIRRRALEREEEKTLQASTASALASKQITITKKATKTGKLYAAITEDLIAEALLAQHKIEVKPEDISIDDAIKAVGTFTVGVELGSATQKLSVVVAQEK